MNMLKNLKDWDFFGLTDEETVSVEEWNKLVDDYDNLVSALEKTHRRFAALLEDYIRVSDTEYVLTAANNRLLVINVFLVGVIALGALTYGLIHVG
jgi:hypothetical protein